MAASCSARSSTAWNDVAAPARRRRNVRSLEPRSAAIVGLEQSEQLRRGAVEREVEGAAIQLEPAPRRAVLDRSAEARAASIARRPMRCVLTEGHARGCGPPGRLAAQEGEDDRDGERLHAWWGADRRAARSTPAPERLRISTCSSRRASPTVAPRRRSAGRRSSPTQRVGGHEGIAPVVSVARATITSVSRHVGARSLGEAGARDADTRLSGAVRRIAPARRHGPRSSAIPQPWTSCVPVERTSGTCPRRGSDRDVARWCCA